MKKFFLILTSLLVLTTFLLEKRLAYSASVLQNPIGVDLTGQDGLNPAPPIGLVPCGKTMCNENEVCTKYPMEVDEHCVPKDKIPLTPPIIPPMMLPTDPYNFCPEGQGVFPPNSSCINNFKNVLKDISLYKRTCIYEPIVEYSSDRFAKNQPELRTQPYTMCGIGEAGPDWPGGPPPGGADLNCAVSMLIYTDVRDADLGSYGPDKDLREKNSPEYKSSDFIAQNYLYDALFGKPLDLSGKFNREESRTYWRLMPAYNQANLRSFTLNMANENQINNIFYKFTDSDGRQKVTNLKVLYSALKSQIILFLHFPFVRIGCLTDYPVCPEYAQAIKELKPPTQDISDYLIKQSEQLPLGANILTTALIDSYKQALNTFSYDIDGPYSAFVPLDFDSVRGYIIKRKDEFEEEFYRKQPYYDEMLINALNASRYKTGKKPALTNVSNESIPYIGAIYQGLLSPKYGLLSALQPSWLTTKYATSEGSIISDYKVGNSPENFPEVKLAREGFLDFITKQIGSTPIDIVYNTLGWIYEQVKDIFQKDDIKLTGYTKNDEELPIDVVRGAYVNFKGCPLPVSYHILSPETKPFNKENEDDHHQVVTVMGNELKWTFAPKCEPMTDDIDCDSLKGDTEDYRACIRNNRKSCSTDRYNYYEDGDMCCQRRWKVYAVRHGKALTVANNPKEIDIKNAIVQESKFSLYKTLIPDAFNKKKITDASIDAPYAANYSAYQDEKRTATAPNGDSRIINEIEPVNRINNRAQDTLHLIQNCWTLPEKLQNSPRCKIAMTEPIKPLDSCKGDAFKKIIPYPENTSSVGPSIFSEAVAKLTDEQIQVYAEAEKQTGVPCEVLAGIHYREADSDPTKDLQSGADLGGRSLLDSALQAATELQDKAGGEITNQDTLIKALSWYNGGGNANCQASTSTNCPAASGHNVCGVTLACTDANPLQGCTCSGEHPEPGSCRSQCMSGFPFQFSYAGTCPPQNIGYDDPYVVELWKPEYDKMYILYKYDCTPSKPEQQNRLGTLTFAINFFLSHQK